MITTLTTIIVCAAGAITIGGLIYAAMRKPKAPETPVQVEEPQQKKAARKDPAKKQPSKKQPATIKPKKKAEVRKKPQA